MQNIKKRHSFYMIYSHYVVAKTFSVVQNVQEVAVY